MNERKGEVCVKMPEGWELVKLGDKANVFRGGSPRPIQAYLTTLSTGINWIKIGDVEPGAKFINATSEKIIPEGAVCSREVKRGDFILSNSMSFGRPYILNIEGCIHDGWLVIQDYQDDFDQDYLYYVLSSDYIINQYKTLAAGSSVQNLNKEKVAAIVLPKPPLPEQHAIAEILSGMDGYIDSLEKLIAKKKAIKQGAMQDLLTGKRRLPGFSGEWVEKSLGKLATINMGQSPDSRFYNSQKIGLPLIQGNGDIEKRKTIIRNYTSQITKIASKGEIILTVRAPVGSVAKVMFQCCLGRGVCSIHYENDFIYYYLTYIEPCWSNLSKGSTFDSINFLELDNLLIFLPCDVNEQSAIAAILSDMDTEIEALTAKLNKAKSIKQGMMQELLTGRIRLVKPVAATSVTKILEFPKPKKTTKGHNQAIADAVILAAITDLYAKKEYPLAPFYAQKFPYLLHRHIEGVAKGFKKLAAGPYNPAYRYRTALPIALKNHYVVGIKATYKGNTYLNLVIGNKIDEAKNYFLQWYGDEPLKWLEQFRYIKHRRDELELLTTVDMAMVELRNSGKQITVVAVKEIIQSSGEWKAKLKREIFSDINIARAIKWSIKLFGGEE